MSLLDVVFINSVFIHDAEAALGVWDSFPQKELGYYGLSYFVCAVRGMVQNVKGKC